MNVDGFYLLSCTKGGGDDDDKERFAVGYYNNFNLEGQGNNEESPPPDKFVYIDPDQFSDWGGAEQNVSFSDATKFGWIIDNDAKYKPEGEPVGYAQYGNTKFDIYKTDEHLLFTNEDGFECRRIYYAN